MKTLFFITLLSFGFIGCNNSETKKVDTVELSASEEIQEVIALLNSEEFEKHTSAVGDVQLIDVRTPKEVAEGTIAGSTNFDFYADDFKDKIAVLDKSKPVYVFCRSGRRSADTATMLKEMGFSKVYDLQGGVIAWQDSGRELIK